MKNVCKRQVLQVNLKTFFYLPYLIMKNKMLMY